MVITKKTVRNRNRVMDDKTVLISAAVRLHLAVTHVTDYCIVKHGLVCEVFVSVVFRFRRPPEALGSS